MLIGLCGPTCSGKQSVVDFLVRNHNFIVLTLKPPTTTPGLEQPASLDSLSLATSPTTLEFSTIEDLDTHVSETWRTNYVLTITLSTHLDALLKRPWFIFIAIDAPLLTRYNRLLNRTPPTLPNPPTLPSFVALHDTQLFSPPTNLAALASHAHLRILNSAPSLPALHTSLSSLDLLNPARLRPSWDQYFMQLADLAARRSNCMKRVVGCVIVREKRVISTGYNGTPRNVTNCNEGGCPRCNGGTFTRGAGLSTCLCLHAEENALLEAGRERIGDGAVLYCNTCPCLTCSVKIVQVGISEVVYSQSYHMDAEGAKIFEEAGVRLRQFSPPRQGLVNLC